MEIAEVVQGSHEWKQLRCGRITASRAADVIATTKKGEAAARRDYRTQILVERLTGIPVEQYLTQEMIFGREQEPFARAAYEVHEGIFVDQVGFVVHPLMPYFGCSPDGLVGEKGMLQIKCPNTTTHLAWLMAGTIPVEHVPQMLAELACNPEREWIDFCSFDPRLPEHLQLFIRRYHRDAGLICSLEKEVAHFNDECGQVLERLPGAPQLAAAILGDAAPGRDAGVLMRRRPIPRSAYRWSPSPKAPSLRYEIILSGAAVCMPDGREICQPNALGRRLYAKRIQEMVQRQNFRCVLCNRRLAISEATFEHMRRRGMHAFKRDDRIVDEEGNWINGAAHWVCNGEKG